MEVQWGQGWGEVSKPVEFAQWYSNVEWHRASADTLRTGMSGMSHLQQRVQHLTVLLGQAEQALQSTQRLRQQEARERDIEQEREDYQDDTLRELQEQQEAQLAALEEDREKLESQLQDMQAALEAAITEKEKTIQEHAESMEEQYKMRHVTAELRQELTGLKEVFAKEKEDLQERLRVAVAKSVELETEKTKWTDIVKRLEMQLTEQQASGRPRVVNVALHN